MTAKLANVKTFSTGLAVLLLILGGVWVFQGIGALKGSFMTGSPIWAWVGAACIAAGIVTLVISGRRSRP